MPAAEKGQVVINEFMPYGSEEEGPFVELFSLWRFSALDLGGYYLQFIPGEEADGRRGAYHILPQNSIIGASGFLTVAIPSTIVPSDGGRLLLLNPAAEVDDCHDQALDQLTFSPHGLLKEGLSYARCPDGLLWLEGVIPSSGRSNSPHYCGGDFSISEEPGVTSASWIPGNFEVHVFDMGQADSSLVIFPSGYTLLLDVGEGSNWNSQAGARAVASRIQQITGKRRVDVGVISHLHLDHLGYVSYGGFYGLLEKEGVEFGKIIDRDAGVWVDSNKDGVCDENKEIQWHNAGTTSGTARKWICYATDPSSKMFKIREVGKLCSTTQISPPDDGAFVKIVTIDAIGAYLKDGTTKISQDHTAMQVPPSENDYSVGLLIGMGNFRYATFGDLDGEYATSSYGYTYNHIEQVVAPRVGIVDAYRVNHHGSGHSSSTTLVNTMRPQVSLFSCGTGNSYGHPEQKILDRLAPFGDIFLTSDCDTTRQYPNGSLRANGNLVLRSTDRGTTFTVFDDAALQSSKVYTSSLKQPVQPPCP